MPLSRLEAKSGMTHPSHCEDRSYSQSSLQRTSLHKFSLISKNPTVSTPDVNVCLRERKLVFLIFFSAN